MKNLFLALTVFSGLFCPLRGFAAPVTINNPSFENQLISIDPPAQAWTDNLEPDWKETGGPNSPNAFMERLGLAGEDGTDTLGMVLGQDVWQDAGVSYEANKLYTLTVKVGNRSGSTAAGNQSVYGLANAAGQYLESRAVDASTFTPVGTFADAPPLVLDTYADPCATGTIRVLLQARGVNRSHFDLIRLDVTDANAAGRPAATLQPATAVTAASATLNGTVTTTGLAAPGVIFYYDTSDKGGNPASWASSATVPGTQTGTFAAGIAGLLPKTLYFYRARVTNAAGAVWAAPCRSFTTAAAAPVVENGAVSAIGGSSALVNVNVNATGGEPPSVTIYYGPADGGTNAGSWASSVTIPGVSGAAARQLTGLVPSTVYFFRAFALNSGGSDWADASGTFTTAVVNLPSIENRAADNITGTSAVINGEVTATGNEPPVVTIFWGISDGGTNPAAWSGSRVLGPDAGSYSSMVQGLPPLTQFYFTARAVNAAGTVWAAPARTFTTASAIPAGVIINEINYDPPDVTKPQEYIEFHNPTAASIDMSGWVIDDGVRFVFPAGAGSIIPAGGYKIVAQNLAAFAAGFPSAPAPVGQWAPGDVLSNSGERIRLRDKAGNVVDEVDYKSGFPWPTSAKGGGTAIELIHPALNNDLGGSWRAGISPVVAGYIPFGSTWRWRRGVQGDTGEPATPFTAWRFLNFTEPAVPAANAGWSTSQAPLGFGDNDGNTANNTENTTTLADMNGGALYYSVYMRKVFNIPAGQVPASIQIRTKSDDGCIIWINGIYAGSIRPNAALTGTGHHLYNTLCGNAPEPVPTEVAAVVSAAAVNLVAGDNVIAIHGLQSSTTSSDFFIDAEVTQALSGSAGSSPGGPNTVLASSSSVSPPAIRGVNHAPNLPAAGQAVVVTATITDPDSVGAVSLAYQSVDPGSYIRLQDAAYNLPANWTTLAMNDSGTAGDAVAGDAVYSVIIPAGVQVHRRLVRYRITAADALSNAVTVPYPDDEQPNFAYFCYSGIPSWTGAMRPAAFGGFPATTPVTFPASLLSSIEPYHLIALDADVASCLYTGPADSTPYRGTLVYEGKVYDHITFNIRGIGSTRVSGKNKLAFKFNRARDFRARDNWGRQYDSDWNSFGLDANASPWAAVHRGSAGVEEATSYRIFELGGMNSLRTHYAHLRIIRKAAESAPAGSAVADPTAGGTVDGQYTSDLWGLYMVLEPTETNFIGERNLPDGNIYAIEGNTGDKKHQSAGQVSDGSDWTAFAAQVAQAGQSEAWYRGNLDLQDLFTYVGLSRLVGNVDVRPGDNYRFYHSPVVLDPAYPGGHWAVMGYDHDMQFIAAAHWGGAMDGVTVAGAPNAVMAMMRHPNIARDYRNRCRELLSLMASDSAPGGGQIGQIIDEYTQMVNPAGQALTWADLDAHMWNLHPRSAGGGANTGQSSHRGNFFRGLYLDGTRGGLGGTVQTASWRRELLPGGVDGFADHEAIMAWFTGYATNTYPAATPWTRKATSSGTGFGGGGVDASTIRQKGYGYKYLEWESLYGGYFNATANPAAGTAMGDLTAAGTTRYAVNGDSLAALSAADNVLYPDKPVISYSGSSGYPVNDIRLHSGDYGDPQNDAIAAVQWRVGEISAPGIPLYDPAKPRVYEIEELWRSAEIPTVSPQGIPDVRVPGSALRAGHTYRARVRHRDATGRWSFWSEPLQFVAGTPDVGAYAAALRISEINYNPGAVKPAESAAPGWNVLWNEQDFEFIEVRNISGASMDMTDIRFTKGIDFDFPAGFNLPAGASAVIVKNPAAFAIRYPSVTPAGTYGDGNLSNGGEEVKLSYGAGASIIEFAYGDSQSGWPASPDGEGPTLVLKTPGKPALVHSDPEEWQESYTEIGNPGGGDGISYDFWAVGDPERADPAADPDRDGYDNRLEFALSSDTESSSTHKAPVAGYSEVSGSIYATLSFNRRSEVEGIGFSVQFSGELMDWTLPGILLSRTFNSDRTQTEIWRSMEPVDIRKRLFGRVLVKDLP